MIMLHSEAYTRYKIIWSDPVTGELNYKNSSMHILAYYYLHISLEITHQHNGQGSIYTKNHKLSTISY